MPDLEGATGCAAAGVAATATRTTAKIESQSRLINAPPPTFSLRTLQTHVNRNRLLSDFSLRLSRADSRVTAWFRTYPARRGARHSGSQPGRRVRREPYACRKSATG